jgi:hypothetical protein
MPGEENEWLSPSQAADWVGIPEADLVTSVLSGEVPALVVGPNIRISRSALLAHAASPVARVTAPAAHRGPDGAGTEPAIAGLPRPMGLTWVADPTPIEGGFDYRWPQEAGGTQRTIFDPAWRGEIDINGARKGFQIGEYTRGVGGRRRAVFIEGTPVCEFAPCTDGQSWASTLKVGRTTVRLGAALPPLYRAPGVRVADYRAATGLTGIGVPRCQALVLDADDLRSAVHHAVARQLGGGGTPLLPAP